MQILKFSNFKFPNFQISNTYSPIPNSQFPHTWIPEYLFNYSPIHWSLCFSCFLFSCFRVFWFHAFVFCGCNEQPTNTAKQSNFCVWCTPRDDTPPPSLRLSHCGWHYNNLTVKGWRVVEFTQCAHCTLAGKVPLFRADSAAFLSVTVTSQLNGSSHSACDSDATSSQLCQQRNCDWLLTDWLTDWPPDWLTDWLSDWLADWLTHWLTDWLTTDWLSELASLLPFSFIQCVTVRVFEFSSFRVCWVFSFLVVVFSLECYRVLELTLCSRVYDFCLWECGWWKLCFLAFLQHVRKYCKVADFDFWSFCLLMVFDEFWLLTI